jgi:hypothetical protein
MTISIAFTFGDGVIVATDSATTLTYPNGVTNVYPNAEKCMNLVFGLPVALATYGQATFQDRSIIRYARDLRERLTRGADDWRVDPTSYTMEELAGKVRRFFLDELHEPAHRAQTSESRPLGLIVCGYSAAATKPEVWHIEMADGYAPEPHCVLPPGMTNVFWRGMGEALTRLVLGYSEDLLRDLVTASGVETTDEFAVLAAEMAVQGRIERVAPLWDPSMPVQDAIDLVQYLADTVCGFIRFAPGPPSVIPPIDVAAITRHEGFRWIRRKHYYSEALNPQRIHVGRTF